MTDLPFAANCVRRRRATRSRHARALGRQPARGGAADGEPKLLTVQPHAIAADEPGGDAAAVERFTPDARRRPTSSCASRARRCRGGRRLARRGQGRRLVRPRRRLARGVRDHRGARRPARRRGRLLARSDDGRLAPAHGPGRPDGDEDRARHLHRLRHLGCDAAHGGLQGGEGDPRDQHRPGGADPGERGLRRDRRPARGRAGDLAPSSGEGARRRVLQHDASVAAASPRRARRSRSRSPAGSSPAARCSSTRLVRLGQAGQPRRRPPRTRSERGDDRPRSAEAAPAPRAGLVHAFIFWGFLVLFPTIFMALDRRSSTASRRCPRARRSGWLEHQGWFAFLVDLFVVLVLVGVGSAFSSARCSGRRGSRAATSARPISSSALITGIVTTLLLWHATQIALGLNEARPRRSPVSDALSGALRGRHDDRGARAGLRVGARADHPGLPRLSPTLEAPAHRDRRRSTSSSAARVRPGASSRSTSRPRTRTTCASGPERWPTSRGSRCSTRCRARSAAAARTSARRTRPARRSPRSS